MGWARGSEMGQQFWDEVREYIPAEKRQKLAMRIYKLLRNEDADAFDPDSNLCRDAGFLQDHDE